MSVSDNSMSVSDESSVSSFDWSDNENQTNKGEQTKTVLNEKLGDNTKVEGGTKEDRFKVAADLWRGELASFLSSLHRSVFLSDLVIHCKDGKLPAHRLVLARSKLLLQLLGQGLDMADICLVDHNVASVSLALELLYTGSLVLGQQSQADLVREIVRNLGFTDLLMVKMKDVKKKKDKLKVKHEKNLSSRKVAESKPLIVRRKRVLMANLDPQELCCDICQKSFPALYKLKIHKLTHSTSFPFICAECGKGFNNKYKLHAHEKKHKAGLIAVKPVPEKPPPLIVAEVPDQMMPDKPSRHDCDECTETFTNKKVLAHHVRTLHREQRESITCPHCAVRLSSQKKLVTHLKAVHNDVESGLRFSCSTCGKKFLKLCHLEDHAMRHNSVRHFTCMYCPKRCATKQDLDRHLRSHSGEASLSCSFCQRTFVHRKTFTNHVRSQHLGQKPYHCRPCGRQFGSLDVLKKHQKSHQRKGDNTRIVTAGRGARGGAGLSFIELFEPLTTSLPLMVEKETAVEQPGLYIPGLHYIQSGTDSITPLSQMQVITDYTEISRIGYEAPVSLPRKTEMTDKCLPHIGERDLVETEMVDRNVVDRDTVKRNIVERDKVERYVVEREVVGTDLVERGLVEDTDSRDDGFILGLFETPQMTTQTTLDNL